MRPIEVLCIEDNEADRKLLEAFLALDGKNCRLRFAHDGVEGLDYLHKRGIFEDATTPDFVILDLNLPRKDGREVLREIKSSDALKCIPVVVFTSSKRPEDVEICYRLQASCYVQKPKGLEELTVTMKRIEDFWFQTAIFPGVHA